MCLCVSVCVNVCVSVCEGGMESAITYPVPFISSQHKPSQGFLIRFKGEEEELFEDLQITNKVQMKKTHNKAESCAANIH